MRASRDVQPVLQVPASLATSGFFRGPEATCLSQSTRQGRVVKRVAPPLICTTKHTLFKNFAIRTVSRATQNRFGTLASTLMRPSIRLRFDFRLFLVLLFVWLKYVISHNSCKVRSRFAINALTP